MLLNSRFPFNLGSLVYAPDTSFEYGPALLPVRLPFNLSTKVDDGVYLYGSKGWELVCRDGKNFQTALLRTTDITSASFAAEMSSMGLGTVAFNLDEFMSKDLDNGRPATDLIDEENLWELWFDGKLRFRWLGQAVKDVSVADNETVAVSVSGPGMAEILKWGMVLPYSYPLFIGELGDFRDDSSSDRLNTQTWNRSTADNVVIQSNSARQDALEEIEFFKDNLKEVQQDIIDVTIDARDAKIEYDIVVKDALSTEAQKQAALISYRSFKNQQLELMKLVNSGTDGSAAKKLADVNANIASKVTAYATLVKDAGATKEQRDAAYKELKAAETLLSKLQEELDFNILHLEGARDKLKLALEPEFDELTGSRIRLSLPDEGTAKTIAAGPFQLTDSGISAVVEPMPMTYTGGPAFTYFKVEYNKDNYISIFTEHTGIMRIRAEITSNGVPHILGYQYVPKIMAYWRIREDDGMVWCEVSGDGVKWNILNSGKVTWPTGEVIFSFSAQLKGFVGIEPPLAAYISQINELELPPAKTPIEKFLKNLTMAQKRGTIPMIVPDFTRSVDSYGAPWSLSADIDLETGTNLYNILDAATIAHQSNWYVTPDFHIKVYQNDYPTNIPDPTVSFHKEDKVIFHTSNSLRYKERNRVRDSIANYIVGQAADKSTAFIEDIDSQLKYNKRELFVTASNAKDLTILGSVLRAYLAQTKDEKSSWRISVDPHLPGKRVFDDYNVGDWIAVETVDFKGVATKDVWRVIGISGNITNAGDDVVELTLQSRFDIFIEVVKRNLDRLNASVSGGGGNASIAAGLAATAAITGGDLDSLEDVVVQNPQTGDVLSWTGSYATFVTPGDATVPAPPAITEAISNVYYPLDDTTTKAQVKLTWITPKNTDGSTITDGHHFEIRYRPQVALPQAIKWNTAENTKWKDLFTWVQPTTPEMGNEGWQTLYVGFDENSVIIQEFTPGVTYEFQMRAVDISSPQHFSDWSVTVTHVAAQDTIAPPQPSLPGVYASRMAVQVTHNLGQQSGGSFNLPPDTDHLEVHVGPNAGFVPEAGTMKGKLNANVGIMKAKTPVVATFQIEETDQVWVRVVAVDKTGNRSTPSGAATATANLIDDAHISDLTVSKVTAGELSANIILSSSIKTATSGARAEMNNEGFQTYDGDGAQSISLAGNPIEVDPNIVYVGTSASLGAGTTSCVPVYPSGGTSGALNLMMVSSKPASATVTLPAGWEIVGDATNGEEISAEDLGSVKVSIFSQIGNATGNASTVNVSGGTTVAAYIGRWEKTSQAAWNVEQFSVGGDASDGADFFAFGDAALSLRNNDYLAGYVGVNSDAGVLNTLGMSAGGVNLYPPQLRVNVGYATGDDGRMIAFDTKVQDGYSFEPPYVIYTNSSTQSGTALFLRISVDTLGSANFITVRNSGKNVATVDRDGRGSFEEISVSNKFYVDGEDYVSKVNNKPTGAVAWGESDVQVVGAGAALSRGWMELAFEAEASRRYSVNVLVAAKSSVADDSMLFVVRDGGENDPAEPFPSSVYLAESRSPFSPTAGEVTIVAAEIFLPELAAGTHRLILLFKGIVGLATINPVTPTSFLGGPGSSKMWVEDKGVILPSVGVLNDGGILPSGGSTSGNPTGPKVSPKVRRTYTYNCTWSGTYRQNNNYSSAKGSTMVQGDGGDAYHGNAKALMGFDYAKIMKDLSGATIIKCEVIMYASHWWNNSGGTAKIGTHDWTSRPGSWQTARVKPNRVSKGNWPKPGQRTVDLGVSIGNDFKSGTAKGLSLGIAPTSHEYYGVFNGFGQVKAPQLRITFQK